MLGMLMVLAAGASLTNNSIPATDDVPKASVQYGDLNLSNEEGLNQLQRRIRQTAKDICGEAYDRDLTQRAVVVQCQDAVLASARVQTEMAVNRSRSGSSGVAAAAGVIGK